MLYYGNINNVDDKFVVFNLTSFNESYQRLDLLPPNSLGATSEYDFDVKYMNWIMSDDYRFCQMFQIVDALLQGNDVYILINEEDWSESLIESLLKIIQQRYGYNAMRINCEEDLFDSGTSDFNRGYGLNNLDEDGFRYAYYIESQKYMGGYHGQERYSYT